MKKILNYNENDDIIYNGISIEDLIDNLIKLQNKYPKNKFQFYCESELEKNYSSPDIPYSILTISKIK